MRQNQMLTAKYLEKMQKRVLHKMRTIGNNRLKLLILNLDLNEKAPNFYSHKP